MMNGYPILRRAAELADATDLTDLLDRIHGLEADSIRLDDEVERLDAKIAGTSEAQVRAATDAYLTGADFDPDEAAAEALALRSRRDALTAKTTAARRAADELRLRVDVLAAADEHRPRLENVVISAAREAHDRLMAVRTELAAASLDYANAITLALDAQPVARPGERPPGAGSPRPRPRSRRPAT